MEIKSEHCEEPLSSSSSTPPSFFKIMLGDFSSTLLIPPAFAKHFQLDFPQQFVLATAHDGRRWHVTVKKVGKKLYFEIGWGKFVQDKSIHLGDFLVFSHVSKLEFNVKIFKRTGCEEVGDRATREEVDTVSTNNEMQAMHVGSDSTRVKINAFSSPCNDEFNHLPAEVEEEIYGKGTFVANPDNFSSNYPFFKVTLTKSYTNSSGFLHIPLSFSEQHMDLASKPILLRVANETWPARIHVSSGSKLRICGGWIPFVRDNSLKVKDVCIFELVSGDNIVIQVSIIRHVVELITIDVSD